MILFFGVYSLLHGAVIEIFSPNLCQSWVNEQTPMEIMNLERVPAFTTKDGSEIRELLAYRNSSIRNQSLAEARLPVGSATQEHYHKLTEEIYYITDGKGRIRIEGEYKEVGPGDAIAIRPGQRHKLWNIGSEPLRLLCCCAPGYEHSDTYLTEGEPSVTC